MCVPMPGKQTQSVSFLTNTNGNINTSDKINFTKRFKLFEFNSLNIEKNKHFHPNLVCNNQMLWSKFPYEYDLKKTLFCFNVFGEHRNVSVVDAAERQYKLLK